MDQLADKVLAYGILHAKDQSATASGTGLQVTPGQNADYDAVAVLDVGAATGTPTSYTLDVTVEESATVNGTYDTLATFGQVTADNQVAHLPVVINPAKPFIRATATIAFTGGTSPTIPVSVVLLVRQNVNAVTNRETLA